MRALFKFILLTGALILVSSGAQAGINIKNGNFYISYTDVEFAKDASIYRTYNATTSFSGIFGYGWSSPLEHTMRIKDDGGIEFTHNGGGRAVQFRLASANDRDAHG